MQQQWCVKKLIYQSIHKCFSTWINILWVGTCNISRNGSFHTAANPPRSSFCTFQCAGRQHAPELNCKTDCNLLLQLTNQPKDCHLPDHSCKLFRITNCKADSLAEAMHKRRHAHPPDTIPLLIQKE
jgi:hypothetical protein